MLLDFEAREGLRNPVKPVARVCSSRASLDVRLPSSTTPSDVRICGGLLDLGSTTTRWCSRRQLAGAIVPTAYRLALDITDVGTISGEDLRVVSEEWGGTFAVLKGAQSRGDVGCGTRAHDG